MVTKINVVVCILFLLVSVISTLAISKIPVCNAAMQVVNYYIRQKNKQHNTNRVKA